MKFPSLCFLFRMLVIGWRLNYVIFSNLSDSTILFIPKIYFWPEPAQLLPLLAKLYFCPFNHLKSFLSFILQCTRSRQAARGHSKEPVWRLHRWLWPWEEITHMAVLRGVLDKCCNCWALAKGNEDNGFAGLTSKVYCFLHEAQECIPGTTEIFARRKKKHFQVVSGWRKPCIFIQWGEI